MNLYSHGFAQLGATELDLDSIDLTILHYLQVFYNTGKMKTLEVNGKTYFWILYSKILNDEPTLKISLQTLKRRRFPKYVKLGLLEFYLCKSAGNYTYYRFTDLYYEKLSNHTSPTTQVNVMSDTNLTLPSTQANVISNTPLTLSTTQPLCHKQHNKDNILNNNKLNNNKLNNKLKDKKDTPPKKTDLDFSTFLQNNISSTTLLNPTNEFIEHRKDMKKPLTYKGLERLVKKINDYKGKYTETEIISFIDKAIVNNWLDLYPPQESDWAKEQARLKEKEKVKTNYDWNEY